MGSVCGVLSLWGPMCLFLPKEPDKLCLGEPGLVPWVQGKLSLTGCSVSVLPSVTSSRRKSTPQASLGAAGLSITLYSLDQGDSISSLIYPQQQCYPQQQRTPKLIPQGTEPALDRHMSIHHTHSVHQEPCKAFRDDI